MAQTSVLGLIKPASGGHAVMGEGSLVPWIDTADRKDAFFKEGAPILICIGKDILQ